MVGRCRWSRGGAVRVLGGAVCRICLRHARARTQNSRGAPRPWLPRYWRWLLLKLSTRREPGPGIVHPRLVAPATATAMATIVGKGAAAAGGEELALSRSLRAHVAGATAASGHGSAFAAGTRHDTVVTGPQCGGGGILGVGFLLCLLEYECRSRLEEAWKSNLKRKKGAQMCKLLVKSTKTVRTRVSSETG